MNKEVLKKIFKKSILKYRIKQAIKEALIAQNEKWITIKPHGEDSKDYRRLKLEDDETPKEAIERVYNLSQKKESVQSKLYKHLKMMENFEKELTYAKNNHLIEKYKQILNKLEKEYLSYIKDIKENYNNISEKDLQEIVSNLEKYKKNSYDENTDNKYKNLRRDIRDKRLQIETKEKADKIGGYTKKINDLMNFAVLSDFSKYDEEIQKSLYENIKLVKDKYQKLKIRFIKSETSNSNFYAYSIQEDKTIMLNDKYYSDKSNLKNRYNKDVLSRFSPKGTDYNSIIVHEIGHIISQSIKEENGITTSKIKSKVLREVGLTINDVSNNLSSYATKNTDEFFAEAFCEYIKSENPRPIAIALGKIVDKLFI